MTKTRALGPDVRKLYSYMELPIGATAVGLPEGRKTGLWRYIRPVLNEKISPCQQACPAGNWIQRFVGATAKGDLNEAWSVLRLENPFPGVCGRVCYHPCEEVCNRKQLDDAISIRSIERALAERFFSESLKPPIIQERQNKKTAVVGAGPAGLACAYFLSILGYDVTIFEAQTELGGIPHSAIPTYRLPREVLEKEIGDILALGLEVRKGCRIGKDLPFSELLAYDAVFLATGAHKASPLKIPSIHKGISQGLEFLARFNLDGQLDLGERILVIGGGNVAIDASRTLIRMGRSPKLIYRRTRSEMPAHPEEINEALMEGLQFLYLLSPSSVEKSENGNLLLCDKMKLEGVDPDGRPRAVPIDGERVSFEADQIVMATGEIPDLSYLPEEFHQANGLLSVNAWGQTNVEKVFAGGDMIDQPWNVSAAIGSAKRAAIAMDHFLKGHDLEELFKQGDLARTMREHLGFDGYSNARGHEIANFQDMNLAYANALPNQVPDALSISQRIDNFREINLGLNLDRAIVEAERCLSCGVCRMCGNCYLFCPDSAIQLDPTTGRYAIDYEYCKGCGICQNECPVGAITIETEGDG